MKGASRSQKLPKGRHASIPPKRKRTNTNPRLHQPVPVITDIEEFRGLLLCWYDDSCRELPWRHSPKCAVERMERDEFAYRVWISEVMLQQTQVVKVIEYFNRWMQKWPTVQALARAELEQVREAWAGLGYYSRATNLHKGAKFILEVYQGHFPSNCVELRQIPGVGPYTSRAIASIGLGACEAVVDGNVIRVLARLHTIEEDPKKITSFFQSLADQRLSRDRPGDYNQAMMELGALICRPTNPQCTLCPVQMHCKAFQESSSGRPVTDFPIAVKKAAKELRTVHVSILHLETTPSERWYLMLKRPSTGLLASLWEFPTLSHTFWDQLSEDERIEAVNDFLSRTCGTDLTKEHSYPSIRVRRSLGEVVHVFSHIRMTLQVEYILLNGDLQDLYILKDVEYKWIKESEIESIGMCSMVRKVFQLHQKTSQHPESTIR